MSHRHDGFVTTGKRHFDWDCFPMRLYQKAKKLGVWDPQDIDLSVDKRTWPAVEPLEQDAILGTVSVFQAGEEAVTLDLLPLVSAVAREGRLEEEMYLTTFLFEEAKHTEFFQRFLHEVVEAEIEDLAKYHTPSYRKIFYQILPETMWLLRDEPTPRNLLRASITYNMIVEGVLAETGYYGFFYQLDDADQGVASLPGLLDGLRRLRTDESRHMAYGIYLISRLIAQHPELWEVAQKDMNDLLPVAMAFIQERLQYQLDHWGALPNDYDPSIFTNYAAGQYQKRLARIEKAREQSLAEVERIAISTAVESA